MTISLANVHQRSESMMKTLDGFPFPGTVIPSADDTMISYDFSAPRSLLRIRVTSPIAAGMIVVGIDGRKFITAEYDEGVVSNQMLYRTLRLFPANASMKWEREVTITDTLTRLEKGTGKSDLGLIWVTNDPMQRETNDNTLRVKEQVFRIITNADVQLDDILDGMIIRRVDNVLGVKLIELM